MRADTVRSWVLPGDEGGQGRPCPFLPAAPRPERRKTHRWRQVPGDAGGCGRGVSRGQIPALFRSLLPLFSVTPRSMGTFPDGSSAFILACARLRHVAGTRRGGKKYMNMKRLEAALEDASAAG